MAGEDVQDKKRMFEKTVRFLKSIYLRLYRLKDSPYKISSGFGVGVFLGLMPGVGPVIALIAAIFLKINRTAALIGSFVTNTWTSVPLFLLSIRFSSWITGMSRAEINLIWKTFIQDFHFAKLFEGPFLKMAVSVVLGYIGISAIIGIVTFGVAMFFFRRAKKRKLELLESK